MAEKRPPRPTKKQIADRFTIDTVVTRGRSASEDRLYAMADKLGKWMRSPPGTPMPKEFTGGE